MLLKIRGYILNWMKLGLGAHNIYDEICAAYGCTEVSRLVSVH